MALFVVFKFNKNAYNNRESAIILPINTNREFIIGKKNTIIIIRILIPVSNDTFLNLSENSYIDLFLNSIIYIKCLYFLQLIYTMRHTKKIKLKSNKTRKSKVFTSNDYSSGEGFLTSVWGPPMWHFLHTMSFNYPVNPTNKDKKNYKLFVLSLRTILPCKYCRINLTNNLKANPITNKAMENRDNFSKFMYDLHETVNKFLGKKSGLTYEEVRDRYENFRARCTIDAPALKVFDFKKDAKEKGCTEPLYGKKSKCVIKIVPQDEKGKTFQMDERCVKHR
jgi:hypothetical protein